MTTFSAPPRAVPFSPGSRTSDASLRDIDALLGRRPRASIALYLRRRRRPPAALRIDLPSGAHPDVEETARVLTGLVARLPGATSAEVVIYGRESDDRSALSRYGPIARSIRSRLRAAGFEVPRSRVVLSDHWADADEVPAAAGASWHRMPRTSSSAGSERGSRNDAQLDPHHGPFVPIARASEHRRARAMAALGLLHAALPGVGEPVPSGDSGTDEPDDIIETLLHWNAVLTAKPGSPPPSDARALALVWSLQHRVVRDCVLMVSAWGLDAGVVALHEAREPATATLGVTGAYDAFLGMGTHPPTAAAVRTAVDVLRNLVASVPESIAAPPLAMLAWLEWARGRGTVAIAYLEACELLDPEYRLARLLHVMIDQGFVPEWISGSSATTLCRPR